MSGRFKVTSVEGWTINQGTHGASGRKQTKAAWQVLDTAVCHRLVREFHPSAASTYKRVDLEAEAHEFAAELERDCA
jgi:hypothetical protein